MLILIKGKVFVFLYESISVETHQLIILTVEWFMPNENSTNKTFFGTSPEIIIKVLAICLWGSNSTHVYEICRFTKVFKRRIHLQIHKFLWFIYKCQRLNWADLLAIVIIQVFWNEAIKIAQKYKEQCNTIIRIGRKMMHPFPG